MAPYGREKYTKSHITSRKAPDGDDCNTRNDTKLSTVQQYSDPTQNPQNNISNNESITTAQRLRLDISQSH